MKPLRPEFRVEGKHGVRRWAEGGECFIPPSQETVLWCWFPKNTSVHHAALHNGCPITVDPLAVAQWESFAAYQKPYVLTCECRVDLWKLLKKGNSWPNASCTHFGFRLMLLLRGLVLCFENFEFKFIGLPWCMFTLANNNTGKTWCNVCLYRQMVL